MKSLHSEEPADFKWGVSARYQVTEGPVGETWLQSDNTNQHSKYLYTYVYKHTFQLSNGSSGFESDLLRL